MIDHPDLDDIMGNPEPGSENECTICHEMFIGNSGDNLCDRCYREQIIGGDE